MTIRIDDHINKFINIDNINNKVELRKFLLCTYALEDCHTKVRYFVEALSDGKRLYIERPTFLNKGCDFILYAEDVITYNNGNDKGPSHADVINDLTLKFHALNEDQYNKLLKAIDSIYNVQPYAEAEKYVVDLPSIGWSYELVLKLLRWLFIEQDITYWAGDGREMLYNAIKDIR